MNNKLLRPTRNIPAAFGYPGIILTLFLLISSVVAAQQQIRETEVGKGWANNSVNTVVFRKNALTTHKEQQFTAYYDPEGALVLGRRRLGDTEWDTVRTPYRGHAADAHNTISIAVDGEGYLHVAWDHHNTRLRYARSRVPFGLELGEEIPMTGKEEDRVTYPEFYRLPGGDLLFFYRSGASGRGNLVINRYDREKRQWEQLHSNLIDGEGQRSAYWQASVDHRGTIHLSWVWRETYDVATNHDLCYARSHDGGLHWKTSEGKPYELPVTKNTAEYAWKIPQGSGLINQTAMTVDQRGVPYIATYWKSNGTPQYQVIYKEEKQWKNLTATFRRTPFDLGGGGTKRIPVSRPQLLVDDRGHRKHLLLLFRDEERENRVSLARYELGGNGKWTISDLTPGPVGQWEPLYDGELWKLKKQLHLFVQQVEQIDGEGMAGTEATPVRILEISIE
ncbi:BNR repeat-containing protein [Sinomicrobium soli]|uniref:BNR repeat-containing protein n=1 Tax=Sinomicrobium sp. N-1-3-6 TaxID=2219864 RepID=UPI000DCB16F2|nr:BNR repeat-containing protein [Sinomicrobium sp. N-1-3-6]RAV29568.1 neuraminidase [Sinomicrobium sp. N-1-3-6]